MQTNILWTGREYHSLENCLIDISDVGIEATSTIIGSYEGKIYKVDYHIKTNRNWETLLLEVDYRDNDRVKNVRLASNSMGSWTSNGEMVKNLEGCIDVDISLTPFTNTLPINRMQLRQNCEKEIQVVYCDLLNGQIRTVRQKYTMLSKTKYLFENIPNDFEATILVDDSGFVVDYPSLFKRTATQEARYE